MRKKQVMTFVLTAMMAGSMTMTAFAYQSWDPKEVRQNWRWEDWDDDGVYECYYYKDNGNRGFNLGTTPDGYEVNQAGAWIVNGVVQTRTKEENTQEIPETATKQVPIDYSAYDPEHPLANVVDAWNLRLVETNFETGTMGTTNTISSWNVHAMLTNQMDQYYMAPVGVSINPTTGSTMYIEEQDYNDNKTREQALYTWYCNWLNGMDFENMSEMDRAKEIQKVLGACHYDQNGFDNNSNFRYDYSVLINKTGVCEEFAMTAMSLAKALGLKSAVSGSGTHAVYYIQVDGKIYGGQNQALNLDYVYTDVYYWD